MKRAMMLNLTHTTMIFGEFHLTIEKQIIDR
jgi:hypothetical protein